MSLGRLLFCILLPPLAVWGKGLGAVIIVLILTCAAWVPGVIAAIFINLVVQKPKETIIVIQQPDPPQGH